MDEKLAEQIQKKSRIEPENTLFNFEGKLGEKVDYQQRSVMMSRGSVGSGQRFSGGILKVVSVVFLFMGSTSCLMCGVFLMQSVSSHEFFHCGLLFCMVIFGWTTFRGAWLISQQLSDRQIMAVEDRAGGWQIHDYVIELLDMMFWLSVVYGVISIFRLLMLMSPMKGLLPVSGFLAFIVAVLVVSRLGRHYLKDKEFWEKL